MPYLQCKNGWENFGRGFRGTRPGGNRQTSGLKCPTQRQTRIKFALLQKQRVSRSIATPTGQVMSNFQTVFPTRTLRSDEGPTTHSHVPLYPTNYPDHPLLRFYQPATGPIKKHSYSISIIEQSGSLLMALFTLRPVLRCETWLSWGWAFLTSSVTHVAHAQNACGPARSV